MFGDGRGFTADLIVAGIIKANLIEAGSITASKLSNDVGASIDLSGNSVIISVSNQASAAQTAAEAAQTTAEAAQASVENLEIGGRNLIQGTLYPETESGRRPAINGYHAVGTSPWGEFRPNDNAVVTAVDHGLKTTNEGANRTFVRFGTLAAVNGNLYGLEAGGTYTLSCDAEFKLLSGTQTAASYNTLITMYHDAAQTGTFAPGTIEDGTAYLLGTYTQELKGTVMTKRVEWTFTIPEAATMIYFLFANARTTGSNYAAGDYFSLANLKLEKGDKATDWTAAPEDYEENISSVQDAAEQAQEMANAAKDNVDALQESTQASFTATENALALRVTTSQYGADQANLQTRLASIETNADSISQSVRDLQNGIGTHFIIMPDKIRITQDHDKLCEQQLTSDAMRFVDNDGNVVASFGRAGGYADRLWSNETLSVGTTTQGWYDISTMTGGIADKWRSGQEDLPAIITEQPVNCYVDPNASNPRMQFSVTAENATAYQWMTRADGTSNWTAISGDAAKTQIYNVVYLSGYLGNEFCCRITGEDNGMIYSLPRKVYEIGSPEVVVQPVPETTVSVGDIVRIGFWASNATQYHWYHLESASWIFDKTTATPVFETQELAALSKTYHCVAEGDSRTVTTNEFVITWE